MRTGKLIAMIIPAVVVFGCIPQSLHPIYTEDSLVTDDGLLGAWGSDDDFWRFEEGKDKSYKLTICGKGQELVFEAHLTRIRDRIYLDMLLADLPIERNDWLAMHIVPVHTFWELDRSGDTLRIRTLKYDWLKDRFENDKFWIAYEPVQEWYIFTAKPERMQRFIRKWMTHEEAWSDWEDAPRMPAAPAPANG